MKTSIRSFLVVAILAAWVTSLHADTKIGVINLRKVFEDYYKTKVVNKKLEDKVTELQKDLKKMQDEYQKAIEEHKKAIDEANSPALSAEEREKRKKEAEGKLLAVKDLEGNIGQFERTARGNLEEQQHQMRDRILDDIRNVIEGQAKEKGFTMVIDTAAETANRTPIVMYSNGENDITESVLTRLNANAPPEPAGTGKKDEKK